jgi:hypothetical protein
LSQTPTALASQQMYIAGYDTATNPYINGVGGNGTYGVSLSATIAADTWYVPQLFSVAPNITLASVVYSGVKIAMNFGCKMFAYDTAQAGQSNTIGFAQRDIQTSTSSSNSYSTFYLQFPPKTMNRPNQNTMNLQISNLNNGMLMTDTTIGSSTTSSGSLPLSDMTPYTLILEFTPNLSSKIATQNY